ncbi:TPA: phage head closure protein [Klebsiella variicola subsp. variicola]|nr:phage head closure protein [Klebsiella variicola subsp. variicola]
MGLKAGTLSHVITFQDRKKTKDAFGAQLNTWVDVLVNVPASIQYLSARELIASEETHYSHSVRIVVRYHPQIKATMRILYRNRIFKIKGVIPDLNSGLEYLTLPVIEGFDD